MKTDVQISREAKLNHILKIAEKINLTEENLEIYGKYKAKIKMKTIENLEEKAKLILTTAITPTPAGEGKSTTSIGLGMALNKIGKNCMIGANSLVTHSIPTEDGVLILGSPAKIVRKLSDEEIKHLKDNADHYVENGKLFSMELKKI